MTQAAEEMTMGGSLGKGVLVEKGRCVGEEGEGMRYMGIANEETFKVSVAEGKTLSH